MLLGCLQAFGGGFVCFRSSLLTCGWLIVYDLYLWRALLQGECFVRSSPSRDPRRWRAGALAAATGGFTCLHGACAQFSGDSLTAGGANRTLDALGRWPVAEILRGSPQPPTPHSPGSTANGVAPSGLAGSSFWPHFRGNLAHMWVLDFSRSVSAHDPTEAQGTPVPREGVNSSALT